MPTKKMAATNKNDKNIVTKRFLDTRLLPLVHFF